MKEVNNSSFKGSNILNNKKNIRRFFILDGCYSYPWDEFFIRTSWDVSSCKPTHLFSDAPRRCIRRTTTDCRPYRPSHVGCRFGRSRSSGLVGRLLRLRLSNREPVLKDRRNPDWCRYRYICRLKRIQFSLRGRLKLLRLSDDLCLSVCLRHRSVRPSFFRTVFLEDFGFNQFVEARLNLQLAYY